MFQKTFRVLAVFCIIALFLSPVYFKHISQYIDSVKIIENEFENISPADTNSYKCLNNGKIVLVNNNMIQILHITSPNCKTCIDDLKIWNTLPAQLAGIVQRETTKLEVINILKKSEINKKFLSQLVKADKEESIKTVSDANISICTIAIDEDQFKRMNIEKKPSLFITKNNKITYSLIGKLINSDIEKLLAIIKKELNNV